MQVHSYSISWICKTSTWLSRGPWQLAGLKNEMIMVLSKIPLGAICYSRSMGAYSPLNHLTKGMLDDLHGVKISMRTNH